MAEKKINSLKISLRNHFIEIKFNILYETKIVRQSTVQFKMIFSPEKMFRHKRLCIYSN